MRPRVIAAVLAAAALLGGCSSADGDDEPAAEVSPSADPRDVAWSPCDGLDAAAVGKLVGAPVTEQTGTSAQPRCAFLPVREGGPAFDLNYLWFDGGLDEAWRSMGKVAGRVSEIDVPGAEAARIVVHATDSGLLVTGFVQTEGLVQSVNAVQLDPYDRRAVVAATRGLLAELADNAP